MASLGRFTIRVAVPWLITAMALYYAFRGIDWQELLSHIGGASYELILAAFLFTTVSYVLRARRWQFMFPGTPIPFHHAVRVIFLGFFMNNILPAKTGELVRAHLGAQVTGETRTLVLATIINERLCDGLTLSLMFVLFSFGIGDKHLATEMLYVAYAFAFVAFCVLALVMSRRTVLKIAQAIHSRLDTKASGYAAHRASVFIEGLSPLCAVQRLLPIALGSVLIWSVELSVYYFVSEAFSAHLPLSYCVLFLVAVNFSSLIPAAPGGIGVIEAIATAALVSVGIEKELALTMVIAQHAIQYIVIGLPGAFLMATWKSTIRKLEILDNEGQKPSIARC